MTQMIQIGAKTFLTALQAVMGVVEKRQTLPILSHVLLVYQAGQLLVMGTDLEIETQYMLALEGGSEDFTATLPARKMLEICRALTEQTQLNLRQCGPQRVEIQTPQGQFVVNSFLPEEFPKMSDSQQAKEIKIESNILMELFEKSFFAIAQEDTRYYMTGLLFEAEETMMTAVATDGHRLAVVKKAFSEPFEQKIRALIPRKAISEILKLLSLQEHPVLLRVDEGHLWIKSNNFQIVTKLIASQYPNYSQVIPKQPGLTLYLAREELKQSIQRVAIFSNDENHGIEFSLTQQKLRIFTHNSEQEQAEEALAVDYEGEDFSIVLSAAYLLDVLNVLPPGQVCLQMVDAATGVRLSSEAAPHLLYVIMPMQA